MAYESIEFGVTLSSGAALGFGNDTTGFMIIRLTHPGLPEPLDIPVTLPESQKLIRLANGVLQAINLMKQV